MLLFQWRILLLYLGIESTIKSLLLDTKLASKLKCKACYNIIRSQDDARFILSTSVIYTELNIIEWRIYFGRYKNIK